MSFADGRALALAKPVGNAEREACAEAVDASDSEPVTELRAVVVTVRDSALGLASEDSDAEGVGDKDADGEVDMRLDAEELIVGDATEERDGGFVFCAEVDVLADALPHADTVTRKIVAVGHAKVDGDAAFDDKEVTDTTEEPDAIEVGAVDKETAGLNEPRGEAVTARGEVDAVTDLRALAETLGERCGDVEGNGDTETRGVRDTVAEILEVTDTRGLTDGEVERDGEGVSVADRRVDADTDADTDALASLLVVADWLTVTMGDADNVDAPVCVDIADAMVVALFEDNAEADKDATVVADAESVSLSDPEEDAVSAPDFELVAVTRADLVAERDVRALELTDPVAAADRELRSLTLVLDVTLCNGVSVFDAGAVAENEGLFEVFALRVENLVAVMLSFRPLAVDATLLDGRTLSVNLGVCVAEGDVFKDALSMLDTLPCNDGDGVEVENKVVDEYAVVVTEMVEITLAETAAVLFALEDDEPDSDTPTVAVPRSREEVVGDTFVEDVAAVDAVEVTDERSDAVGDALTVEVVNGEREDEGVASTLKEASTDRDTLSDAETESAALEETAADSVAAKLAVSPELSEDDAELIGETLEYMDAVSSAVARALLLKDALTDGLRVSSALAL